MNASRFVSYGSTAGVAFGGFTWVVVAGNLIGEPAVSLAGAVTGFVVWWLGARSLIRFQRRQLTVFGIVILAVVFADWAFLAYVLPRIPEPGGSIYFGTSRSAYLALEPVLLVGGVAGVGLVLWDSLRRR